MTNLVERRRNRSRNAWEAVGLQLAHSREQGRLEALVLASDDGLVVAEAGDASVCGELAAVAPYMNRTLGMPMTPLLRGAEVSVRTMRVHGMSLHLACVGGSVARDAVIACSLKGVERILTAS
jgi:hypothetical protein